MPEPTHNPLDKHIRAIIRAPEYLSEDSAKALYDLISPLLTPNARDQDDSIRSQVTSLLDLQKSMLDRIQATDDIPLDSLHTVVKTGRELCLLLMKLNEFLNTEKREAAIEAAVVQALKDLDDPDLLNTFLENLYKRLAAQEAKIQ